MVMESKVVSTTRRRKKDAVHTSAFAHPWQPDQGDGTYCNPILHADYSDPDIIRVGEDFYLTASSFNCTPGLPILHSRDLVNWRIVNHALKNLPHPRYSEVQPGCGVWAPSIRSHAGKFWIFFPMPDEGVYVIVADHPEGNWSEPHLLHSGKGLIDPCPLWDDDGKAYLVHAYAKSRSGIKHMLRVRPMAPDASELLGDGEIVAHDPDRHPTLEGPKFLKKDGWYYILAPAGGVESGWQVVLRSRNVYGPYEDKITLQQGNTGINGPHQGALIDTPKGSWWFAHFQDSGVYGRIVHLQPVTWKDGWPLMGKDGEPLHRCMKPILRSPHKPVTPQTSDDFSSETLGLQWQWQANHQPDWYSLDLRPGWLRLYPQLLKPSFDRQPNVLLQKLPARSFVVETLVNLFPMQWAEEAGLVVIGRSQAAFGIQHDGTKNHVVLRINDSLKSIFDINANVVRLRVTMDDGGICSFAFQEEGKWISLPEHFHALKGFWIGAKIGLYSIKQIQNAVAGHADFDYFRFVEPSLENR